MTPHELPPDELAKSGLASLLREVHKDDYECHPVARWLAAKGIFYLSIAALLYPDKAHWRVARGEAIYVTPNPDGRVEFNIPNPNDESVEILLNPADYVDPRPEQLQEAAVYRALIDVFRRVPLLPGYEATTAVGDFRVYCDQEGSGLTWARVWEFWEPLLAKG